MNLTGKCKADFEKWYFENHCQSSLDYTDLLPHHIEDIYGWFYDIPESMQYGVLVDFFDSVGIEVYVKPTAEKTFTAFVRPCYDVFNSRPEARTAAIEKANEIYNERNS